MLTATQHQSLTALRSLAAPNCVAAGLTTLSYQTEQEVSAPPLPAVLLMLICVSPPGTVNVLLRCVPTATAQALAVTVVTLTSISSSSVTGGPAALPVASIAPLPFVPLVSIPVKRQATASAGSVLLVTVTVICPALGLAPIARKMWTPFCACALSTAMDSTKVRPLPLTITVRVSSRTATNTSTSSFAPGVQLVSVKLA